MTTNPNWETTFAEFRGLNIETQRILRNSAAQSLINDGCEEVGSSDISHALFKSRTGRTWRSSVIIAYVDES